MTKLLLCMLLAQLLAFVSGHGELEAAEQARKMVYSESLLHFNSLTPCDMPISMIEYYVSSDVCRDVEGLSNNGNPILLLSQMSTSYKNWRGNGTVSMTIEEHSLNPLHTPMSSPRGYLLGHLKKLELSPADERKLAKHFVHKHPDARHWLPNDDGTHVHDTLWLEFDVKNVYFVGGFGSDSYIGYISGENYHEKFRHHCGHHHDAKEYGLLQTLRSWFTLLFTQY